jgi:hypothetical protein
MASKVPGWKPAKGTMSGKDYGKAVSSAAKAKGDAKAGNMKPLTPKMPTAKRR